MKKPRISTRSLMALVLLVGLALGLGLPAWSVLREKELQKIHGHVFIVWEAKAPITPPAGYYTIETDLVATPFWTRYWRRLTGFPWVYHSPCRPKPGQLEMVCEYDQPEFFRRQMDGNGIGISTPPLMQKNLARMRGHR